MTITSISFAVLPALVVAVLAWYLSRQQSRLSRDRINQLTDDLGQANKQLQDLTQGKKTLCQEKHNQELELKTLEVNLLNAEKSRSELALIIDEIKSELDQEREEHLVAAKMVQELNTRLEEQQKNNAKSLADLEENRELLKKEFSHLATDILDKKGAVFAGQQKERLEVLLKPFREQLGDFQKRVERTREEDMQGRANLMAQIKTLHDLNQQISSEATNLTTALKGDKKLQGNWGEMQVEKILESSGLIKGQGYEREVNFKDEDGNNMRPDFVVYLPEDKHLIIDSKVSLVDYLAYVGADNEDDQKAALARHIQSIRNHIKSLSAKDYAGLPGVKAPDFVFMFMPIEPAFLAAFQQDQHLLSEAFEKRVVVVTPTTLLATLRTVANLWSIEKQNANARKLAERGRLLYDKLHVFVTKMEKLDAQINNVRKVYDEALLTMKHGNGNLIWQAQEFLQLGVRVKKELPAHTRETADLGGADEIAAPDINE